MREGREEGLLEIGRCGGGFMTEGGRTEMGVMETSEKKEEFRADVNCENVGDGVE